MIVHMPDRTPVILADIAAARRRIAGHIRRTPLVPSGWLSRATGSSVGLKLETLQVTQSFKSRGALNAAMALRETAGPDATIVTASAGNHGRAIAWAAERLGLRSIVFTPRDAPRVKLEAIRRHGADLRPDAASYEEAERLALAWAEQTGATFISPYDNRDVIAGGGTIGLELIEDEPELGVVLVPVGGGGLISGIATALRAISPAIAVIGVEAAASRAFHAARAAGRIVTIDVAPTIADGLGGNVNPETMTWPVIRDIVRDIVVVPEDALRAAIRELVAQDHLVAEGAGIAAAAALGAGLVGLDGRRAAVVLSGANIDLSRLAPLVQ